MAVMSDQVTYTDDFHCKRKLSHATTKSTCMPISKDEWHTNGKSIKNVLYILQYAKGTSWAKATSKSEKIQPLDLVIVELYWSEGIRQLVSRKFC